MKCGDVRGSLLDLSEGTINPEQRAAVQQHLGQCDECRAELAMLQRGRDGLEASLEQVAPVGRYLTEGRMGRLLGAFEVRAQQPRIITLRRFIAAAAAAAILVSFRFIYADVRSMLTPKQQPGETYPTALRVSPLGPAGIVALTPTPEDHGLNVVFEYLKASPAGGATAAPVPPADLVRTISPGIDVPVQNAFYDCQEAGCWW